VATQDGAFALRDPVINGKVRNLVALQKAGVKEMEYFKAWKRSSSRTCSACTSRWGCAASARILLLVDNTHLDGMRRSTPWPGSHPVRRAAWTPSNSSRITA